MTREERDRLRAAHAALVDRDGGLGWTRERAEAYDRRRDALVNAIPALLDALDAADEAARRSLYDDEEVRDAAINEDRWQDRIEETIVNAGLVPFDASGNESGDPLDYTADQVRHALDALTEQRDLARANAQGVSVVVGQQIDVAVASAGTGTIRAEVVKIEQTFPDRHITIEAVDLTETP